MARRLLLLNGLATLGVVLNHAASWVYIGMFWWTDRYQNVSVPNFTQLGEPSYYVLRLIEQVIAFTVPSFLFVSGFFVAFVAGREPLRARWWSSEKRIRALLVPYLIWSTILLFERYIFGTRYTPTQYLEIYLTGRAADPYYYVPLLCQCLLLAPLLVEAARRNWKTLLVTAAVVQLAVQALRYPMLLGESDPALRALLTLTPGWFFPGKIFWFVFGIVTGLYLEELQKRFFAHRWHCLAAAAALLPLGMVEWEVLRVQSSTEWITYYDTVVDSAYAAAVIITVIAFSRVVPPFADSIEHVGRHSYGVYLVHSIVLVYGARAIYHLVPAMLEQGLMFFVFLSLLGLAVPLIAMRVMKQSRVKGAYKYVFG